MGDKNQQKSSNLVTTASSGRKIAKRRGADRVEAVASIEKPLTTSRSAANLKSSDMSTSEGFKYDLV
jgi:hypothetical protein